MEQSLDRKGCGGSLAQRLTRMQAWQRLACTSSPIHMYMTACALSHLLLLLLLLPLLLLLLLAGW
jgi:hypothetical protein